MRGVEKGVPQKCALLFYVLFPRILTTKGGFLRKFVTKNGKRGVLVACFMDKLNKNGRNCRVVAWEVLPNTINIRFW